MEADLMIGDIAAIATAVGVAIVLVQIEAQRRQRRAQFEEDFTKRYWTILDGLSLAVQRGADTATDADRVQAHAYFRLSDEQIFQSLKSGVSAGMLGSCGPVALGSQWSVRHFFRNGRSWMRK
ncbi:hypothetical protein [Aeromicrobium sp.]|uniref:hypothetical protein n=1 Tax=Aeromicrobium sp. TaxID=1871063 RepID=UPI0019B36D0C|nr:hypothetical protein [Aeromicrobium sp.]MBC7630560.1 hypothetical protein [Aeromicrobium sp.]